MRAALGRTTLPEDDLDGAEPVIVLTRHYWSRVFGEDPDAIGKIMELNGKNARVVGVLEGGSHYTGSRKQDFYVNYATNDHYVGASMKDARTHRMTDVFARLAPGASVEAARSEVVAISDQLHREYPDAYAETMGYSVTLNLWQDELTRDARPIFTLLMGTVAAVLLLACANLANLTLTRLVRREGELMTRVALGKRAGIARGRDGSGLGKKARQVALYPRLSDMRTRPPPSCCDRDHDHRQQPPRVDVVESDIPGREVRHSVDSSRQRRREHSRNEERKQEWVGTRDNIKDIGAAVGVDPG